MASLPPALEALTILSLSCFISVVCGLPMYTQALVGGRHQLYDSYIDSYFLCYTWYFIEIWCINMVSNMDEVDFWFRQVQKKIYSRLNTNGTQLTQLFMVQQS